jgi:hypothetical protein
MSYEGGLYLESTGLYNDPRLIIPAEPDQTGLFTVFNKPFLAGLGLPAPSFEAAEPARRYRRKRKGGEAYLPEDYAPGGPFAPRVWRKY